MSISEPAYWRKAKERCLSLNSQLATIGSTEENNFVASVANNHSWIGAEWNEPLLDYMWVDGSRIVFNETWKSKQTNDSSCVAICESAASDKCNSSGEWHQHDCVHLKPFVCERKGKGETLLERTERLKSPSNLL